MTVRTLHGPTPAPARRAPAGSPDLRAAARARRVCLPPGVPEDMAVQATVRCLSRRLPRDLAAAWPRRLPASWRAVWHTEGAAPTFGDGDFVAELSDEVGLDATRTVVLARAVAAELDARLGGAMSAVRQRLPEDVQTVVPRGVPRRATA